MSIVIIIAIVMLAWALYGYIIGFLFGVKSYNLMMYEPYTIFINGPIWWCFWVIYIIDHNEFPTIKGIFEPKIKEEYKDEDI